MLFLTLRTLGQSRMAPQLCVYLCRATSITKGGPFGSQAMLSLE